MRKYTKMYCLDSFPNSRITSLHPEPYLSHCSSISHSGGSSPVQDPSVHHSEWALFHSRWLFPALAPSALCPELMTHSLGLGWVMKKRNIGTLVTNGQSHHNQLEERAAVLKLRWHTQGPNTRVGLKERLEWRYIIDRKNAFYLTLQEKMLTII